MLCLNFYSKHFCYRLLHIVFLVCVDPKIRVSHVKKYSGTKYIETSTWRASQNQSAFIPAPAFTWTNLYFHYIFLYLLAFCCFALATHALRTRTCLPIRTHHSKILHLQDSNLQVVCVSELWVANAAQWKTKLSAKIISWGLHTDLKTFWFKKAFDCWCKVCILGSVYHGNVHNELNQQSFIYFINWMCSV